jgi:hypothetical protein
MMNKRTFWRNSLILLSLLLIVAGMTACTKTEQVAAPTVSPEQPAPPLNSPSILGLRADIVMEDGVLTNNINFGVDSSTYITAYFAWAGDYMFYLDVTPPLKAGQAAATAQGTYQEGINNVVVWKNVAPGMHTLSVQLVTANLTPLDPHISAGIAIGMPSAGTNSPFVRSLSIQMLCEPGYVPPGMPGRPQGSSACADIIISPEVNNFTVYADKIGQPAAPGEGHFIYYFNVNPPTTPGKPALTEKGTYAITADRIASWVSVLPGEYQVWVQLVNNDNTPFNPPVIAGGSIIVPIDADRY